MVGTETVAVRPIEGAAGFGSAAAPHDEAEMIAHARRGDTAAFAQLVARYRHRVFGLCLRLCGNREDAEDHAQETFVRAYGALARFDGRAQLFTWLYRIAVNVTLSARRRAERRPATRTGAMQDGGGGGLLAEAPSNEPEPASRMETEEQASLVWAALTALDDDQRSIITLRDMESLGYDQIAVILEIPVGTVKSRLHRARLALRDRLLPQLGGMD